MVKQNFSEFEQFMGGLGLSPNTVETYVTTATLYNNFVGSKGLAHGLVTANEFLQCFKVKGDKTSTVVRHINALKCYYRFLGNGSIKDIPIPKTEYVEAEYIDKGAVIRILNACRWVADRAIFQTMFACGLRLSELTALDKDDLNRKNGFLRVYPSKIRERKPYYVPIDQRTIKIIDKYLSYRDDKHPVLFSYRPPNRLKPETVRWRLKKMCEIAGVGKIHPHTLRHSRAYEILQANPNLLYLQKFLRHKSIKSTEVYSHLMPEDIKANVIEAF